MGSPRVSFRTLVVCLTVLLFASVAGAEAARTPGKAPKKETVAGELIVRFKSGASEAEQDRALAAAGAKAAKSLGRNHTKLAKTDPAATERALKILATQPSVEYAEPNYRVHALAVPNDPSFTQLWGLRNTGQTVAGVAGTADADIDADEAWEVATGSRAVTVAVIDTGVDFGHPDLGGSMSTSPVMWTNAGESCTGCRTDRVDNDGNGYVDDWRGWDFVNNDNNPFDDGGHGTHVAGTIGALGNNAAGVAGVNWNVKIMALKFLDETGSGSEDAAIEAVRYATRMGATASNNSWGGGEHSQALFDAIVEADAAGSLFVAAAGNDAYDNDSYDSFPASYDVPNVISVAATDQSDQLAGFSNYGSSTVDLGAPGVNIYSTIPGGGYDWYDGTSMATPHVTGVAALAKAAHPGATALGLKGLLLGSVDGRSSLAGFVKSEGRLNAARAVSCAGGPQVWIDKPSAGFRSAIGNAVELAAIGSSCGNPAGTTISATVNGQAVTLSSRGDGLFTGSFTPAAAGEVTVSVTAANGAATNTRSVTGVVRDNYRTVDGPYAWIDATAGGTKLTLTDDDSAVVALPFPFRHFDASRSSVEISSNGYLMFDGIFGTSYMNTPIPDAEVPDGLVAAYWDDLNPSAGGAVWYRTVGASPNRKFVVAWVGVPAFQTTNGVTFEAILEEGTNDVVLQYKDVVHGNADLNYGASATVGVEDDFGSSGNQFLYNQPLLQPYQAAKSLRFTLGTPAPRKTTAFSDFDADGDSDIGFYRPSDGVWVIRNQEWVHFPGQAGDIAVPGDYDGDGDTDIAFYRPSTGVWVIRGQEWVHFPAASGDVLLPADYDGDGDTDIAFYRPSTAMWVIRGQEWVHYPLLADDVPLPADYDGDGDTDIAFYRPSTAMWVIRGQEWVHFPAASGDVLLPSDYDGDGDTDIAFYRPSTGVWAISGQEWVHYPAQTDDVLLPADYDGDGDTDIAFYRPSTGVWVIRGQEWVHFPGSVDDIPLPLPQVVRPRVVP